MIEDKDKKRRKVGLLLLLAICIAALTLMYFIPSDDDLITETHLTETTEAQKTIFKLRKEVDESGIDSLTSSNYARALKTERNANNAFASGDYTKAIPFYKSAINLYQEALKEEPVPFVPEAPTPEPEEPVEEEDSTPDVIDNDKPKPPVRTKSASKPNKLKQQLEAARSAMLQARSAASAVDASNLAPSDWQTAERSKGEGDRRYNSGSDNESSIETNIKSYEKATEHFLKAKNIATPTKNEQD